MAETAHGYPDDSDARATIHLEQRQLCVRCSLAATNLLLVTDPHHLKRQPHIAAGFCALRLFLGRVQTRGDDLDRLG